MQAQGHEVCVASMGPLGPVADILSDTGIDVRSCEASAAYDMLAVQSLSQIISGADPDLIHSFLFHANIACRIACLLSGFDHRRLICEIQTVEIERRWHLIVDGWTQCLCRWIVGNSPSVIEHLRGAGRIERDRLRLIWGGVDVEALDGAVPVPLTQLQVPSGDPVIAWVGRLDPIKGLDVLIRAVAEASKHCPLLLLIVGEGELRSQVEDWVQGSGIADRIHMLGRRDDVASILKSADLFAFPSRTEGLPNALLEAMAVGLPIITTDAPGCRDLIQNERTGIVVPVDDHHRMAEAMLRVLGDAPLKVRLSQAAREHIWRNFRQERSFRQYAQLYGEATSARQP